jgi:hypothetical protein
VTIQGVIRSLLDSQSKVLVIVDVQMELYSGCEYDLADEDVIYRDDYDHRPSKFGFDHEFITRLKAMIPQYDEVYQIFDGNFSDTPSFRFQGEIGVIKKHYGFDIDTDSLDITDEDRESDGFRLKDGRLVVRTSGSHEWFLVEDDLEKFILSLKGKGIVHLAGGKCGECLEDVYSAFLALDVPAKIVLDY